MTDGHNLRVQQFAPEPALGVFPIDSPLQLTYDQFTPRSEVEFLPDFETNWFSMASSPDKSPAVFSGKSAKDRPAQRASDKSVASSAAASADVAQELEQLRDRYSKTTTALASAAHDLKTPLAILNGYIELLQSQKLGPLNDRQREVMSDMFSSGQRLQQFIQDFLTFSVLETGELRMQYIEGDINACLSEVCRLWSGRFQERGLALYFLANDKLTPFAFDGPKIQRIISNLLENASKYTTEGGTVWLHAEPHMWERRSASNSASGGDRRRQSVNLPNAVKVSVADTGPGIRPEFHLEIFDDFFRLPGSESAEGMGLGLAIARRLLQGMSGKIWVESEPGSGCKFSFLIPMKPIISTPPRGTK
jgi:signal transduction histidine kinase